MPRRRQAVIRKELILAFSDQALSIRQVSEKAGVDWYTAERQLAQLKGRDLVEEVFSHRLLRLFRLTQLGKETASALQQPGHKQSDELATLIRRFFT
jgi:predicted transcriptional regulator